ncbi:MAG TPA: phosphatidylserine decarboxylase family protein [Saprospirales bacterium]|nr:phosphatidylserine decarboxylase family protein [Saprospirales bacterium]
MLLRIHKEGTIMLIVTALILIALNVTIHQFLPIAFWPVLVLSVAFFIIILQFFRNPLRQVEVTDNHLVYAPADGRVCVIEEVYEPEYFKEKRLQVSIFMSPLNVHVNLYPFSGIVNYVRYHKGKYLVAWHPKSSTENERSTVVLKGPKAEVLIRQIAGAVARRIVTYSKEGEQVHQNGELGFIKFGSRVNLYLPLGTKINAKIGDIVHGGVNVIATLS